MVGNALSDWVIILIVSVIPARGGSKGIPLKNLVNLGGRSLIYYSIIDSLKSICDRTIVSTEDNNISNVAKFYGAEVINRPMDLATDLARTEPVVVHAIHELGLTDGDIVVLLQPTSPVRPSYSIDKCIDLYMDSLPKYDAVFTAYDDSYYHWREVDGRWVCEQYDYTNPRLPRQEYGHRVKEVGSIYITSAYNWINYNRFGTNPIPYMIDPKYGIELDEPWQIPIFESILEDLNTGGE